MKKLLFLTLVLACFALQSALATINVTATPSSQSASPGGMFTVTLTLNITQSTMPSNATGYDLWFEAPTTQNSTNVSGRFSITGATAPPTQPNWIRNSGGTDSLTTANSDHTNFVQGLNDGFSGDFSPAQTVNTPIINMQLATYTFTVAPGTPLGTYNFATTLFATEPSLGHFSDIASTQTNPTTGTGGRWPFDNQATFSINVVPEPTTWALLGLGALGFVAVNRFRARR